MAEVGEIFEPGDKVPNSGIYLVIHDPEHRQRHEVTCIYGKPFPPCHGCAHPRFKLVRKALHIMDHESFKK